jgi:Holliday junction resolvase
MHTYKKGYRAEKELIKLLSSLGYATLRAPKSGKDTIDVIACKKGQIFVFECKSWKSKPKINEKQLNSLLEFARKAGAIALIAIKLENEGWKFLRAEDVRENKGNVSEDLLKEKSFSVEFFEKY